MTDGDDTLPDSIDADALRAAIPTERVRNVLHGDDGGDADDDGTGLGSADLGDTVRGALRGRDSGVGLLALAVGFDGLVYGVGRYLPEYLGALGASPVVIGLFGTLALALPALYAGRLPSRVERVATVVCPCVAAAGLVLWLLAPGGLGPIPSWVLVLGGLPLVAVSLARREDAPIVPGPDSLAVTPRDDDHRAVAGAAAGIGLVTGLLVVTTGVDAALRIALALAAVCGVTLAALRAVTPDADRPGVATEGDSIPDESPADEAESGDETESDDADANDADASGASAWRADRPGTAGVLGTVAGLAPRNRSLLVGETLVDAAVAAVSVFVIVVVVRVLEFQVTLLGVPLGPSAVFGALVLVELGAGGLAGTAARRFEGTLGSPRLVAVAGAVAAGFPLLLVSVPPVPWIVAGIFGFYGLRTVGAAARRDHVARALDAADLDHGTYRTVRDLVVAPSAAVGGVLYAVDPTLAFGAATAVGTVGAWELRRFAFADGTTA